MCVRVVQGKGAKDRYVPLPGRSARRRSVTTGACCIRARGCLPPPADAERPLHSEQALRWYWHARDAAGITKAGGIHTLRHCYATHLLEAGWTCTASRNGSATGDISTTARYLHLARPDAPDGIRRAAAGAAVEPAANRRPPTARCGPSSSRLHVGCAGRGVARASARPIWPSHGLSAAQAKAWRAIAGVPHRCARRRAAVLSRLARPRSGAGTRAATATVRRCQKQAARHLAARAHRRTARGALRPLGVYAAARIERAGAACIRALVYETLLGCTAATLTEFAANPRWLGGQPRLHAGAAHLDPGPAAATCMRMR